MEPFWIEALKQAPSMGVLVWLVVYFLRHLEKVNDAHSARYEKITNDLALRQDKREKDQVARDTARDEVMRETLNKNSTLYERILEKLSAIQHKPGEFL